MNPPFATIPFLRIWNEVKLVLLIFKENVAFSILFKCVLHLEHFKYFWVATRLSPKIISTFDFNNSVKTHCSKWRVSLENNGKISLLKCYRTAARICPQRGQFKNRTPRNKASFLLIFIKIDIISVFLFSLPLSLATSQWPINISACIHIKYSKRQAAIYFLEHS